MKSKHISLSKKDLLSDPSNDEPDDIPIRLGPVLFIIPLCSLLTCILFSGLLPTIRISPQNMLVCVVEADLVIKGRVFVQLSNSIDPCGESSVPITYQSNDYGQSWQQLINPPKTWQHWHVRSAIDGLTAGADNVWYKGHAIWTMPRSQFNRFFEIGAYLPWYRSPISSVAPAGQGVLYAALGPYGVLVGPNPEEKGERPWRLVWTDFSGLELYGLKITNPFIIAAMIFLALTVPPLPWINAWLIGQVWRYLFPISETSAAMDLALRTSGVISVVAALGIALWMIDTDIDFYQVVAMIAGVSVIISVVIGVHTARQRHFTDRFTRRLAAATALLSLTVPLGAASSLFDIGWPLILFLLLGFMLFRDALRRYLNRLMIRITIWQMDRLTLEIEVLFILIFIPTGLVATLLIHDILTLALTLLLTPFLSALALAVYTIIRGKSLPIKKKISPLDLHELPLFSDFDWMRTLQWYAAMWFGATALMSLLIFTEQHFLFWVISEFIRK